MRRSRGAALASVAMLSLLALSTVGPARSASAPAGDRNPLRDVSTGAPLSCPDPNVLDAPGDRYRYVLVCTSDLARDAIPIRTSKDLVHWYTDGFVFPRGHQPWWALASTAGVRGGRYWAPEIYLIRGRWVVYFAAQYDPAKVDLRLPGGRRVRPGAMVLGVATASSLRGPWRTRLLHYRGEFDRRGGERENGGRGGAIDPSVLRDPGNGQRYLFWADQSTEIWAAKLSADGLTLDRRVHKVLSQSLAWECDPAFKGCWVEAPEPFYRNGLIYLLYSGASTWDATYSVGVAVSRDPLRSFVKLSRPILRTGRGFIGPGHSSHPVVGPDGKTYILYHALRTPSRSSANRLLMLDPLDWVGRRPRINDGRPGG